MDLAEKMREEEYQEYLEDVSLSGIDPFENAYFGVGEKVGNAFKDGAELK